MRISTRIMVIVFLGAGFGPGVPAWSQIANRAEKAPTIQDLLGQIVAPPELASGDIDGALKRWADGLTHLEASPLLPLCVIRMRNILPLSTDPGWLLDHYRSLLQSDGLTPQNRDVLTEEYGRMLLRAGKREEFENLALYSSRLTHWWLIGPFGFRGGSLHVIPFPPEEKIDLEGSYPGFLGDVSWVPGRRLKDRAGVNPFRFLYPSEGSAYALSQFQWGEGGAVIDFETAASAKIWLNGEVVLDVERLKEDHPSRWRLSVTPRTGWNQLLVKVSGASQASFSARVLGADGEPLRLQEETGRILHPLGAVQPSSFDRPVAWDLRVALSKSLAEDPSNPDLLVALAIVFERLSLHSRAIPLLSKACQIDKEPLFHAMRAEMALAAEHLPAGYRKRTSAQLCDQALSMQKDLVPALQLKASRLHSDDRGEEAIAMILDDVIGNGCDHFYPRILLSRIFSDLGWELEREEALEEAWDLAPGHPIVSSELADLWAQKGRPKKSLEYINASLAFDQSQTSVRKKKIAILQNLSRFDEAEQELSRLWKEDPDRIEVTEELADFYTGRGKFDEAIALRRDTVKKFPRYPAFKKRLADLLWKQGDMIPDGALEARKEARLVYEEAVRQTPGYHRARDLLAYLDESPETANEDGSVFEDEELVFSLFRVDTDEILQKAPGRKEWPTASSLAVFDDVILRVFPDGSTRSETQQVFRIFDSRGIERHGTVRVDGELIDIRSVRSDGVVLEPITLSTSSEYTMPGLDEGAFVVVRYFTRTPSVIGEPIRLPSFFFRDVDLAEPFVRSRYVVITPQDLPLQVKEFDFGVPIEKFPMGSDFVYIFERTDMSAAKPERFMPEPRTFFPRVTLQESRPYLEVNSIYRRELLQRIRPTEELRAAAENALAEASATTDRAKAKVLYHFVRDHVQNEAGSGEATGALVTREGSRFFLFLGLLGVADIPFEYGRARPAPELDEDPDWSVISENLYIERVARVLARDDNGEPILISEDFDLPFGKIPTALRGGPALFVNDEGGTRTNIPNLSEEGRIAQSTTITILALPDASGFDVSVTTAVPSVDGHALKSAVRTMEETRRQMVGMSAVNARLPGGALRAVEFPGLDDEDYPFEFRVEAFLPIEALEQVDGARTLRLPFETVNLTDVFASGRDRVHPIEFKRYDIRESRVTVTVGGAFSVRRIPGNLELTCGLGSYSLRFEVVGDEILIHRLVRLIPGQLAATDYQEFMKFCRAVDEKEREKILLEPLAGR